MKMRKILRERASDSVYQILRDSILTQVFRPGERLNVRDLAAKLDVSPTPVKEAVNRLAVEGLVTVNPRSGTYVTEISAEQIAETFEVRTALECLAAEKALARMTPQSLGQLRTLIESLEKPVRTERDRSSHEQRNNEFHTLLVELSGNRRLIDMYASLNAHINIARVHHSREGWEERVAQERDEHREILGAIENNKPAALVRAVRRHIERAAASLIEDVRRN